jgi:hypothetical protein
MVSMEGPRKAIQFYPELNPLASTYYVSLTALNTCCYQTTTTEATGGTDELQET